MKKNPVFFPKALFFIFFLFIGKLFSQGNAPLPSYHIGDNVKDSVDVYDTLGNMVNLKIPGGHYLIIYRYTWRNLGSGIDTQDSIRELEKRIGIIMSEKQFVPTKVICISYNLGPDFANWQNHIKKEKPFKSSKYYNVEYYNTNGKTANELKIKNLISKVTIIDPNGKIIRWSKFISQFDYNPKYKSTTTLKGKLMTDNKGIIQPLPNAVIHLESSAFKDTLATTTTNHLGEFELNFRGNEGDYTIKVNPKNQAVHNIILATNNGKEVSKIMETKMGFEFKILKPEITLLSEMHAEDVDFKYENFSSSTEKELFTTETIFYDLAKSEIQENSKGILKTIVKMMNENPKVKLEIISHTDSQGDDASNMELSKKRSESVMSFLILNGVAPERLKAIGKGETQIINQCINGVKCTDRQHEYNRRTEFRFIK